MSRREFQFSDGSSNKFWAIVVEGKSQTVQFGRVGTTGKSQIKKFGSEDEARGASDKLIAEKVRKGYVETPNPMSERQTAAPSKGEKPVPAEIVEVDVEESPPASPSAQLQITRAIDLPQGDWLWATWRDRQTRVRGEPKPFDLNDCLKRLSAVKTEQYGWDWKWELAQIADTLTKQEAEFWWTAMSKAKNNIKPNQLAARLGNSKFTGSVSFDKIRSTLVANGRILHESLLAPLANLLSFDELTTLLLDEDILGSWSTWNYYFAGFLKQVLPYLTDNEICRMRQQLRPRITPDNWINVTGDSGSVNAFHLAACLGMHQELLAVVESWPDDHFVQNMTAAFDQVPQQIIFGLGDSKLVAFHVRRLRLPLRSPAHIRAWLACTEFAELDYAAETVLAADNKQQCQELLEAVILVKAPEAATTILNLGLHCKAPSLARKWLEEQVGNAIAGLIPTAAGRGKLAEAAIEYLRDAKKKKGHEQFIRECLKNATHDVAESIQKHVLDFAAKEYQLLDVKSIPAKLKAAFEAKATKGKLPGWAALTALPPLVVGEKKLGDEHVASVLEALQRSTLDQMDPVVSILKEHADAASLDAFAWKVFQLWQSEGAPSKEKWAMAAVGLLGGDVSALKLTPLVRNWPGESQHQRAVFGLECLRAIGSDTALMQLNGIAQKLKFKGLKQKAVDAMEAIANDKGLTRSQLEDRIVPDCDLDERGSRVFDFGPRQFRFVLGPEMKPMLKDADGKVKTDLPKPGAKDDASKANEAVNAWKLMKKQVKEVANIQAQRLEQAMVTSRRWPLADFETLLVKHPLMTNLVRLILWGGYDKKDMLAKTFRVTEDQTYADAKDAECALKGIDRVGIVHPLHLGEAEMSAWGEIFSDYEIVPPFPQLGRAIYRLEMNEEKESEIKRFVGVKLVAPTLVFGLEKFGWARGTPMDGGGFDEHSKPFPSANVTAVVTYQGSVAMGYIDPNEILTVEKCYFVEGNRGPSGYAHKEKALKLGAVDPVAVSEVLTDLTALAAKGK